MTTPPLAYDNGSLEEDKGKVEQIKKLIRDAGGQDKLGELGDLVTTLYYGAFDKGINIASYRLHDRRGR